jgi:hypothetical protein
MGDKVTSAYIRQLQVIGSIAGRPFCVTSCEVPTRETNFALTLRYAVQLGRAARRRLRFPA